MEKINRVAIVGGVHGNEFTGAYLSKKFEKFPELIKRPSFESLTMLGNPQAFQATKRYIDRDLNRCFSSSDLQNSTLCTVEDTQAKFIYQTLGPKGNLPADFILDLHTTTANMGLSIILGDNSPFNLKLAAHLSSIEPSLKVYTWIELDQEPSFLNCICDKGFGIEIGPIPQGILNADIFQKTEGLVQTVLDYLEKLNRGEVTQINSTLTLYTHLKVVDYPKNDSGEIEGMIHPDLQGKDYEELNPGDPIFITFDGTTIYYEEEATVWPVFINEAAYYEKGIAMCLTKKETVEIIID